MPRGDNAGRPRNGAERMVRTPVTLPPDLRSYAKRAGGGSVSAGVRLALQAHMDAAQAGSPVQELQVWRHKPTACYYLAVWRGILSAAAAPAPTEPTFTAPDLGDVPTPTIKVAATVQDGQITSVGGLTADQLAALGVALPALPANINDMLTGFGAQQVDIVTSPNKLSILLDGQDTINLEYDQASLLAMWNLLKPQLAGSPLADPALQSLIEEQFLPLLPGSNINLAVTLE